MAIRETHKALWLAHVMNNCTCRVGFRFRSAVETPVRKVERKKESLAILAEASCAQAHSPVTW